MGLAELRTLGELTRKWKHDVQVMIEAWARTDALIQDNMTEQQALR